MEAATRHGRTDADRWRRPRKQDGNARPKQRGCGANACEGEWAARGRSCHSATWPRIAQKTRTKPKRQQQRRMGTRSEGRPAGPEPETCPETRPRLAVRKMGDCVVRQPPSSSARSVLQQETTKSEQTLADNLERLLTRTAPTERRTPPRPPRPRRRARPATPRPTTADDPIPAARSADADPAPATPRRAAPRGTTTSPAPTGLSRPRGTELPRGKPRDEEELPNAPPPR